MASRLAADATLLVHLAFVLFAVFGAALALRWRWMPFVHVPAAAWAFWIELAGEACPLTSLENHFRILAGQSGYAESFIEHYVLALLYPVGLTRPLQWSLAGLVIVVNLLLYTWVIRRRRRMLHNASHDPAVKP